MPSVWETENEAKPQTDMDNNARPPHIDAGQRDCPTSSLEHQPLHDEHNSACAQFDCVAVAVSPCSP